jgi:hypothetical protein
MALTLGLILIVALVLAMEDALARWMFGLSQLAGKGDGFKAHD